MTDQTVTFVNVIDVDPAKQAELVDLLTEGAEKVFQHRPGFVSLTVLASKDRSRVINSAQWRSVEDLQATQADPDAQDYAKRVGALAQGNPNVFSVVPSSAADAVRPGYALGGAGGQSTRPYRRSPASPRPGTM